MLTRATKYAQRGALLVQILVTLAIIGILSALTLPGMGLILQRQDLESGQNTLIEALHKAKWLARARGTDAELRVDQGAHSITVSTVDGAVAETIQLPERATVADTLQLRVSSNGVVTQINAGTGAVAGADVTITLLPINIAQNDTQAYAKAKAESPAFPVRRVVVSTLGSIAGLSP